MDRRLEREVTVTVVTLFAESLSLPKIRRT